MVSFFKKGKRVYYAIIGSSPLSHDDCLKLSSLFGGAVLLKTEKLKGVFLGPRKEMVSPESTILVEIASIMGISGLKRIEKFVKYQGEVPNFDKMLFSVYQSLSPEILNDAHKPEQSDYISDIEQFSNTHGLALSHQEINYLIDLSKNLGRPLTDCEIFGFAQINSEHCRHKIFNGSFVIDNDPKEFSLFDIVKDTVTNSPGKVISAFSDNVAFTDGPRIKLFAPSSADRSSFFRIKDIDSVLSFKAETHNFPTTVEPFNGAATGSGGEIRDRLAGGRGSTPLAGTAVYMTSYPRLSDDRYFENFTAPRNWLYHSPAEILIRASDGVSDFGNKFGQPLICGSLLTFEHENADGQLFAYDKVLLLAAGVGFADKKNAFKLKPYDGLKIIIIGGDNYRIGLGGGSVSSLNTGLSDSAVEFNSVQRANPEMQKRVANLLRALSELDENPVISVHDLGAGGNINALAEICDGMGCRVNIDAFPLGDDTLSPLEILCNESQERMAILLDVKHLPLFTRIAARERVPFSIVGEITDNARFTIEDTNGKRLVDLPSDVFIGLPPSIVITDNESSFQKIDADIHENDLGRLLCDVLSLDAVACKDWLTNKVDRSVSGLVARQQCCGELQLPLADCGVISLDFTATSGIATSVGHAPFAALADSAKGSVLAIAEALTNIVGANLSEGLKSVSLSANWMWPCKNPGMDAALYRAVEACSNFAKALGINIPTGKDSLSMTLNYNDLKVLAPPTVVISASAEVSDVKKTVSSAFSNRLSTLYYIDFSSDILKLGGSALFQTRNLLSDEIPCVNDVDKFIRAFNSVQQLVERGLILAIHDVSAGGLVTTLLEMTFANQKGGVYFHTTGFSMYGEKDLLKIMFAENPAVVIQVEDRKKKKVEKLLDDAQIKYFPIGYPTDDRTMYIEHEGKEFLLGIDYLRDVWFKPSYNLDRLQSGEKFASLRFENYRKQPVRFSIPKSFNGFLSIRNINRTNTTTSCLKAAVIREKGINGDRELAYALFLAGFEVKDVHMTDLISGKETLDDINFIAFPGGFSNGDVCGSAKGWASAFRYNPKAYESLMRFYNRHDTLSIGVCNGCQLMIELNLLNIEAEIKMEKNRSGKFESNFIGLTVPQNNSVMLGSLSGMKLGCWTAHSEGRFKFSKGFPKQNIAARYSYNSYPSNPNGSTLSTAALVSRDGRHLAIMPHIERSIFPWQCAVYPTARINDEVTPWFDAFVNARVWLQSQISNS